MNENHRLIKDVSNALNFYMERTRREEGFDLSGVLRPGYDLNQFKFNKLFGYSTGYDTTMKKILMPQLSLPKAFRPESEEIKLREKFYKDELKYHLRFDRNNRKNQRPKSQGAIRSKSVNEFVTYNKNGEKKSKPKVPAGVLTIRSTHTPALTKREKLSMVNITSKIMSASSELCFQKEDILLMKSLADAKGNNTCYVKKTLSQSRRDEQEEYERRLLNRHKEYERQNLLRNLKNDEIKELENDAKNQEEDDVFESSDNDNKKLASSSITPINETSHNRDNNESRLRDRRTEKLNQVQFHLN